MNEIQRLRTQYYQLRDTQWKGVGLYDEWINSEINNAKLVPFGLYHQSGFPRLPRCLRKRRVIGRAFYAGVAELANAKPEARKQALAALELVRALTISGPVPFLLGML